MTSGLSSERTQALAPGGASSPRATTNWPTPQAARPIDVPPFLHQAQMTLSVAFNHDHPLLLGADHGRWKAVAAASVINSRIVSTS